MSYYNRKPQNSEDSKSREERALDLYTEAMIKKLETIQGSWQKPWFTESSSMAWPRNMDGRAYNSGNAMMLMMLNEAKGYDVPVFVTYPRLCRLNFEEKDGKTPLKDKQGNELPRILINKGEKSMPVFLTTFTVINQETNERISIDDYNKLSKDEQKEYKLYPKQNVFLVFNVGQTNMKEVRPELYQSLKEKYGAKQGEKINHSDGFSFEPLDRIIKDQSWVCPIKVSYQDRAFYSLSQDYVQLPTKEQFISGEHYASNAFHELGHSLSINGRLDRIDPTKPLSTKQYSTEELIVELSAAITAQRNGMTKTINSDSLPYVKNWLESLHESPQFIKTIMNDVKKTSDYLQEHIDRAVTLIESEKQGVNPYLRPVEVPDKEYLYEAKQYIQSSIPLTENLSLSKNQENLWGVFSDKHNSYIVAPQWNDYKKDVSGNVTLLGHHHNDSYTYIPFADIEKISKQVSVVEEVKVYAREEDKKKMLQVILREHKDVEEKKVQHEKELDANESAKADRRVLPFLGAALFHFGEVIEHDILHAQSLVNEKQGFHR